MKRYLVFAGNDYYPSGGIDDLLGSVDKWREVKAAFTILKVTHAERPEQLVDPLTATMTCSPSQLVTVDGKQMIRVPASPAWTDYKILYRGSNVDWVHVVDTRKWRVRGIENGEWNDWCEL